MTKPRTNRIEPKTRWAQRVRDRRDALGLSQDELVALTQGSLSQPSLSQIETGTRAPTDRVKGVLAAALDTTVAELFPYDEIDEVAS